MSTIEVTLALTRHVTFYIERSDDDPVQAVTLAEGKLMYDGGTPDDEGIPDLDVERIKIGDREIHIHADIDLHGPKDERGLARWKFTAYADPGYRKLLGGYVRAEVIRKAFAQIAPSYCEHDEFADVCHLPHAAATP